MHGIYLNITHYTHTHITYSVPTKGFLFSSHFGHHFQLLSGWQQLRCLFGDLMPTQGEGDADEDEDEDEDEENTAKKSARSLPSFGITWTFWTPFACKCIGSLDQVGRH